MRTKPAISVAMLKRDRRSAASGQVALEIAREAKLSFISWADRQRTQLLPLQDAPRRRIARTDNLGRGAEMDGP